MQCVFELVLTLFVHAYTYFYPSWPPDFALLADKSFLRACFASVHVCVYLCVSHSQHVVQISSVDTGANTWQRKNNGPQEALWFRCEMLQPFASPRLFKSTGENFLVYFW